MANYLNSISVGLIVLNLFLRLPLQAVGAECVDTSTCVTRSLNFADHGVMSGHLELSLALLQAHVSAHSVTLIGLRLALVDDIPVDILSNVPSGTYDVEVDDDATGRRQPDRASYLTVITQIGLDHIAPPVLPNDGSKMRVTTCSRDVTLFGRREGQPGLSPRILTGASVSPLSYQMT